MSEIVSVIIPVYNAGKYLDKLLCSLESQTYKNLEIIFIDDASSDDSLKKCEAFKEKNKSVFSHIKIIHHEICQGVSGARNDGLRAITGLYVAFIDSDDWIDDGYFEEFVEDIEKNNSDIEIRAFVKEKESGEIIKYPQEEKEHFFKLNDEYDSFAYYAHRGVWGGLFRSSILLLPTPILFDEKIKIGEDLLFYTVALSRAQKAHYKTHGAHYHYVEYPSSSYNRFDLSKDFTVIDAHKKVVSVIAGTGFKNAEKSASKYLMYKCYDFYYKILKETDKQKKKLFYKKVILEMRELNSFVNRSDLGIRWKIKWHLMQFVILK